MTENNDRSVTRLFIRRYEEPAAFRFRSKHREKVGGSHRQIYALGLIGQREISRTREYRREVVKDCVLGAPIQEVGGTNLDSLAVASECLNGNEAFSPRVRQRPK